MILGIIYNAIRSCIDANEDLSRSTWIGYLQQTWFNKQLGYVNLISWSPHKVWIICSWALCVCVSSVRGKEWNKRSNPFLRFVFLSEEKLTVHLSKGWKQESELVNKAEKLAVFLRVIANPKSKWLKVASYLCYSLAFNFIVFLHPGVQ